MICSRCQGMIENDALYCGYCGKRTRLRHDSQAGTIVDGLYRIEETLARGGFGCVYRATHVPSGGAVALKVLHADHAADPTVRARFARESSALARLRSPHTVVTFHRGEARDGTLYIVMELLAGESLLERFLGHGRLPWKTMLAIMRAVCSSLAEAHACRIVHRDLKPGNIHLGNDDLVKVLDFGIAKLLPQSGIDDLELTAIGQTVGTLEYMAPEQLVGGACDGRTDLYALGVVVFEMLTGRRPFGDRHTPASLVTAVMTETPAPVSDYCLVPREVDRLVARCLDRDPHQRFASAVELAGALDRILHAPAQAVAYATTR